MASVRQALEAATDQTPGDDPKVDRLQGYLDVIASYEREFKKWEGRVDKILKRYRDEQSDKRKVACFNILWSNVQTLVPATFSRLPQPDVSRRFRDNDPVGRVAALILERALEFEVQHYKDYRQTMTQSVHDRFLGGRGSCWARYEPKFKPSEQITEDSDAEQEELLDDECAPTDYVHWKDFGHNVARTWEEVTLVWRRVYMNEAAVTERFGEEIAKKLSYDSAPEDLKKSNRDSQVTIKKQACIYELWDKETGTAIWLAKTFKSGFLDERDDPLKLQDFFPCPPPLYATITNESMIPVPDFTMYQDQAAELDVLSDRIDGLAKMLQVKGVYDGSADSSLARLFTEGENGTLLPVKNWAAFAEKAGLKGQIDVLDLTPIAKALESAYLAMENVKGQVYEITGISDIIRGQGDPNATATSEKLKGQYASLRLKALQQQVARYATDILRLKAQIICTKFQPQTILMMAAVDQLTEEDKQVVPQALALLVGEQRMQDPEADAPNPMRSFRIEIAADTLVEIDEQTEKQDRMEMLTAFGGYLKQAAEVGAMAPAMIPLIVEVGKFGLSAFKVGKAIEGSFDAALDQLKQVAAQPPVDPKVMEQQITDKVKAELEMKNASKEMALAKKAADLDIRELKFGAQQEIAAQQQQFNEQSMQQQQQHAAKEQEFQKRTAEQDLQHQGKEQDFANQAAAQQIEAGVNDKLSKHKEGVNQTVAKVKEESAKAGADQVAVQAAEQKNAKRDQQTQQLVEAVVQSTQELQKEVAMLVKSIAAPKEIQRGPDGRAKGIRTVNA